MNIYWASTISETLGFQRWTRLARSLLSWNFTLVSGRHNKQINGQAANSDKRSKENKQSDVKKWKGNYFRWNSHRQPGWRDIAQTSKDSLAKWRSKATDAVGIRNKASLACLKHWKNEVRLEHKAEWEKLFGDKFEKVDRD